MIEIDEGSPAARGARFGDWAVGCLAHQSAELLAPDDVRALGAQLLHRRLDTGHVVSHPGQWSQGVWLVSNGGVELTTGNGSHRRVVTLARAGDVFDDIPLLLGHPCQYRAQAVHPTTCLLLPAQAFTRLLTDRPALTRLWPLLGRAPTLLRPDTPGGQPGRHTAPAGGPLVAARIPRWLVEPFRVTVCDSG